MDSSQISSEKAPKPVGLYPHARKTTWKERFFRVIAYARW